MLFEDLLVTPRVLKVKTETVIKGKFVDIPRDIKLGRPAILKLISFPRSGVWEDGQILSWDENRQIDCTFEQDGTFSFSFYAPAEEEYVFRIFMEQGEKKRQLAEFSCYALEKDLFALRPLKGDTHVHTCWSECGSITDEPSFTAAYAHSRGLDFTFITDHCKRTPSIEAINALAPFECDFKVYPGEECHIPRYPVEKNELESHFAFQEVHLLSLGASESIIQYANDHFEEFSADIALRKAELNPEIPDEQRHLMAGADWIIEKTHQAGGVSIFCHPFWTVYHLMLPPPVREYILQADQFDAVELIGMGGKDNASYFAANLDCLSWLRAEEIKRGTPIPVTGSTDSHDTAALLGYQYTLVFAAENTLDGVLSGIRAGKTLACRCYPGENPVFLGEHRLVRYAGFLAREFFPEHDEICCVSGKLMLQALRGDIDTDLVNAYSKNRLESLFRRYWAN